MIWDACLARAVAAELHADLEGARAAAVHFERESQVVRVHFRERLFWADLSPRRGVIMLGPAAAPHAEAEPLPAILAAAEAVPDERIIVLRFRRVRGRRPHRALILELAANRRNALWTEGSRRVVRKRLRAIAGTAPGAGQPWRPPDGPARAGGSSQLERSAWDAAFPAGAEPSREPFRPSREAVRRWMSQIAWVSPLNARWLLAAADGDEGFRRWQRLARGKGPQPSLLRAPSGLQPYPWPLPGSGFEAERTESLLAAMEAVLAAERATGPTDEAGAAAGSGWAARAAEREQRRLTRMLASLRRQLERTRDAGRLRENATLILSSLRQIRRGADRVTLADFDGKPRTVKLNPALRPQDHAEALFRLASRMERGREKIAERTAEAETAVRRIEEAIRLHARGDLPDSELAAMLPRRKESRPKRTRAAAPTLPYRQYRSSGGLEIRVGRGARHNDDLTFRHSRPSDLWLHARGAAGAHVILRWTRSERPPAADLEEAATLAANHSDGRTSGVVPVDWTRRKWVRKPRGAPPGAVVPERTETVFVSPDPSLEERLRKALGL